MPAELCTKCNPDLVAVFKETGDWCNQHGLPESQCKVCNPGLDFSKPAAAADWCKEHGVPESMCTKCHPELVAKFIAAGDYCREHGFPQSVCPRCDPARPAQRGQSPAAFPAEGTIVRLASPQTVQEAGVRTVRVTPRAFSQTLSVVGRIDFDQNSLAQLSARGDAIIVAVHVDVGDSVRAGQPLVTLASPAVGEARARLLAARARVETARSGVERQSSLLESRVASVREVEEARQEMAAAEGDQFAASAALRAAGATPGSKGGQYTLSAPFAGTVVVRDAVAGRSAASGEVLVQVADLRTLWALLDVPEEDALVVQVGQRVKLTLEAQRGEVLEGTIDRVSARVDPQSRTLQARMRLPNPDGRLKAGLFARAEVQVAGTRQALLVPRDAVQRAEGQALIFVKTGETTFRPVAVETGAVTADQMEIRKGLPAGSEVVTTGAFLLKTEILKDSIGAGCCDVEEKK